MFTFRTHQADCGRRILLIVAHSREPVKITRLYYSGSLLQITEKDTGNLRGEEFMEVQQGTDKIYITARGPV
jgi:hypothetical protein